MRNPYKLLVHRTFKQQAEAFLERNPSYWGSFINQCRKACSDPFRVGKPLARVGLEALKGRIYRLWVGGRNKYRFIYIVDRAREAILPVFLSREVRGRINYDKIPWEEYANQIYDDYVQNNISAFAVWRLPK